MAEYQLPSPPPDPAPLDQSVEAARFRMQIAELEARIFELEQILEIDRLALGPPKVRPRPPRPSSN